MITMKKIIWLVIVIALVAFFWPKSYVSSPGFVTPEGQSEFEASAKKCLGFSYLTNPEAMAADAPGQSLCFGWLTN